MTILQFPIAKTAEAEVIRSSVFLYPDSKTRNGKTRYGVIVFRVKKNGLKEIMLSGQGEWGVCLAVALAEVTRLREAGEVPGPTGQGVIGVPVEYRLEHPIIAYKSKDKILGAVRGFQTVHEALVWLRSEK